MQKLNEEKISENLEKVFSKSSIDMLKDKKIKEVIRLLSDDVNSTLLVEVIKGEKILNLFKNKDNQEKLLNFLNLLLDNFNKIYSDTSRVNAKETIKVITDYIQDRKNLVKLVLKSLVWEYLDEQSHNDLIFKLASFVTDDKSLPNYKKPILILGATGTGKELIAEAIHLISKCRNSPFIAINCSAMPDTLIESELFGHIKGSFSGATENKIGYIEVAGDGTILIDEVGDMPISTQTKLLRLLNDKTYSKLGETRVRKSDARFIFATNKDLMELISEKRFKEDFFYRINTYTIKLTSLNDDLQKAHERESMKFFEERVIWRVQKHGLTIDENTKARIVRKLSRYSWQGNYRQLYNVLDKAFAYADIERKLTDEMFELDEEVADKGKQVTIDISRMTFQEVEEYADSLVREKLKQVLQKNRGNLIKSAVEIGLVTQEESKSNKRGPATEDIKEICIKYNVNYEDFVNKNDKRYSCNKIQSQKTVNQIETTEKVYS